jgi:hypothetical protein
MTRFKRTLTCSGLLAGSFLALSIAPAQAFSFTTNFTGTPPTGDILLDSVVLPDSSVFSNFSFVSSANIISSDVYAGGNTGAASSDYGDDATGLAQEAIDNAGLVSSLGNPYLSQIIDTEDVGSFVIDLTFDKPLDKLFFWERGGNSKLDVQLLDASGTPTGNLLTINSALWNPAGFDLNTTEILDTQVVTSEGLDVSSFGVTGSVSGIRVAAQGASYNGPDFKIAGAAIPEPAALAGLGLVAGWLAVSRRKSVKA